MLPEGAYRLSISDSYREFDNLSRLARLYQYIRYAWNSKYRLA